MAPSGVQALEESAVQGLEWAPSPCPSQSPSPAAGCLTHGAVDRSNGGALLNPHHDPLFFPQCMRLVPAQEPPSARTDAAGSTGSHVGFLR